jgi:hypothetical protein
MELPAGEKKMNERSFFDRSQFCGDGDLQLRVEGQNGTFTRAWALPGVDNISAALGSKRTTHAAYWPTLARAAKNSTPRHRSRAGTVTITNASIELALAASGNSIRALRTHCPETKEAI